MISTKKMLRWALPVVVSTAVMVWLFLQVDFTGVVEKMDTESTLLLLPALLVYGLVSLVLEAQSVVRVFASSARPLNLTRVCLRRWCT